MSEPTHAAVMAQSPDSPGRRPLRLPPAQEFSFEADDGARLRLTRFTGGLRGPVILAPGFGTSRQAFLLDTVEENLPETLVAAGYDVWVFEYRASPGLPVAGTQFTLDDIARRDWPAAVARVREISNADSVQVVAHCVGSMTFLMAMLSGMEGVRSAICSQLTLYPHTPAVNRLKAGARLAEALSAARLRAFTTDSRAGSRLDRSVDTLLALHPAQERCASATCRRISLLYGDVFAHDRLNQATHDSLGEMFGVANMTAMRHIARLVRAGHLVDAAGGDTYMPHLQRLAIPITFVHGERNHLFLSSGSAATYETLRAANGPGLYRRHIIPGYAHMDCFIGERANHDVFPLIREELDRWNTEAPND